MLRACLFVSLSILWSHLTSSLPTDTNTSLPVGDDSSTPNSETISLGDWDGVCAGPYEEYYRIEFADCNTVAREFDFDMFPKVNEWILNPLKSFEAHGLLECPYSLFFRGCKLTIDYWPKNQPIAIKRHGSTYSKAIEIAQKCTRYKGHSGMLDYIWGGHLRATVPEGHTVQVTLQSVADPPDARIDSSASLQVL